MRTALRAAAIGAAALIGGCDGGGQPAPAPQREALTVANPFHDQLAALAPLQRGAALRRAIRAAKEPCDRVERAAFQQDHDNLKMWVARCQKKDYAMFVAPNGDVQVRSCADMAALKLPACRAPDRPEHVTAK